MRGGSIRGAACALAVAAGLCVFPGAAAASVGNFGMTVQPDGRILVAGGSGRVGGAASGKEFGAVVRYKADGSLDRSFGGGDGVALIRETLPFTAIALQPDGRILATAPLGGEGGLARLLPNGRLDRSFGSSGILYAGASSAWYPTSVAVGGDGSIFVGGLTGYLEDPAEHWYGSLYRITPDGRSGDWVGSMTSREGEPGEPKTNVNDFVIEPGRVIGAGTLAAREPGARSQAVLARLIPATTGPGGIAIGPDPSFGGGGAVVTRGGRSGLAAANAVAAQPGGGIYVAGKSEYSCAGGPCAGLLLAHYKGRGKLDRRFARAGMVRPRVDTGTYGSPATEIAYDVAARAHGTVFVGGLVTGPGSSRFFLRRYLADGKPDPEFGNRGRLTTLPLTAGTPAPGSGR